eukprot:CAMPEP_0114594308 /NCGR_PEP_ID=MMETSP0125-20121206/15950_1 /TAXON_ID=485358 ORGANISM="Aristerostoma sp., Strain ATCC 50986" /NCGR_SAMPLE_ID=MMETSP0125 /ASSEMBLY_ACC=CAM_ASM_000245 /LENGTH=78 /DNA_ID=CAMNT_0001794453 /DNA_START=62 /DNA_END=298 /DNA_ORIENTATION=+
MTNILENRVKNKILSLHDDIIENFTYDETLVYAKSTQYELIKKNLLDILEYKRKTLQMEIKIVEFNEETMIKSQTNFD